MKILIYGYGNPGRQDDALGVRLAEHIEAWIAAENMKDVKVDCNYQLNIEDAELISHFDKVIFADASIEAIDDFICTPVVSDDSTIEFSMHAVSPAFVLDLCNKLYHKNPECYLIHIKGYEWDFIEALTEEATMNLAKAIAFIKEKIQNIS